MIKKDIEYLNAEVVTEVKTRTGDLAYQVQPSWAGLFDTSAVVKSTPTANIQSALQAVEDNFTRFNERIFSIYYEEAKTVGGTFTVNDYNRWVDILSDLSAIIEGGSLQWGRLELSGGDTAQDINGNDIYIRGGTNG